VGGVNVQFSLLKSACFLYPHVYAEEGDYQHLYFPRLHSVPFLHAENHSLSELT